MKTKDTVVWLATLVAAVSPAWSHVLRIEFSSQVTQVEGSLLPGVTVGSTITGQVQVDLAQLPQDYDPQPTIGGYSYAGGHPGFTIRFNAGSHSIMYDSINGSRDPGVSVGIFLTDDAGNHDWLNFQLRNQDDPIAVILNFEDVTPPFTHVIGDYFPESINFKEGIPRAIFQYFDNFGFAAVIARNVSATMTIDGVEGVTGLLMLRVNSSNLSAQRKRSLVNALQAAEEAFAKGDCEAGLRHLKTFQNKVHAQVDKSDPMLAARLITGAQAIIEAGCGN
ncbi:MAG: hypothetical protein L0Y58_09380 [Verrucomicrobia subdivision 3 bacterium]|nr:hypothetical protein [Limisphaerales bacterium]